MILTTPMIDGARPGSRSLKHNPIFFGSAFLYVLFFVKSVIRNFEKKYGPLIVGTQTKRKMKEKSEWVLERRSLSHVSY